MPLISDVIPNFVNGISQQTPRLRQPTQGAAQDNGYSSLVEGLNKRPPIIYLAKIISLDGSPVDVAELGPYDVGIQFFGKPTSDMVLMFHVFDRSVKFPAGLAGSEAVSTTAASGGDVVFDIQKSGVSIGSCTFSSGSTRGVFAMATDQTFTTTGAPDGDADYIQIIAPSNMHLVSVIDVSFTLKGERV